MTPREIVQELDKHIIGQHNAKRAVAVALRNRWRRMQLEQHLRDEITPKNILMMGPTGVGKTEIARRLARLADAPFIKIEATKFTEVGYVGRDVESIIRDLADIAIKGAREQHARKNEHRTHELAEEKVLDALMRQGAGRAAPSNRGTPSNRPAPSSRAAPPDRATPSDRPAPPNRAAPSDRDARQELRARLRQGDLDDEEITIETGPGSVNVEVMSPPGAEALTQQIQKLFKSIGSDQRQERRISVANAMKLLMQEESEKMVNDEELQAAAVENVEQKGIVFLDEIDKLAKRDQHIGGEVSREGVQRDLLPLIEGSTVSTKYGMVKTDHILFIASGAFHFSKPSDLIPELQGRLPIRVELESLDAAAFVRILAEPDVSLIRQYCELMATENMTIEFTDEAIETIAGIAYDINQNTENIGARRLHTVMERLLEEASFAAPDSGGKLVVDADYVNRRLADIARDHDLSRYIL
ncbi:MAG: ATP-dependent protease ATPase subunit HslU [Gammaproteobacteria bacterium]|nr:ATP-dependent protease ATPase subunit HslU [Gammaproteobacteria bacterium]